MPKPAAYDPQDGYKFQILCRNQQYSRAWEHCDYAEDRQEREHLISNYSMAYGAGWEFKTILQPRKYWPKKKWVNTAVPHDILRAAGIAIPGESPVSLNVP